MKEYFFNLFFNTIFIDLSLPFYILWINKIQEIFLWTSFPLLALSFQSTFANFLRFEKLRTHLSLFLSQGTKVMKSNPLEKEFFWNNFNTNISLSILLAKASFGFLLISMLFYWFQTTFKYDTQRAPLPKALWGKGSGGVFLGKLPLLTMWSANLTLISLLSIRWIESGHFPLSNLYESLLFLSWSLTTIHLFLENTLNKREKARISPLVSMQSNASLPLLFVGAQRQRVDSSITLGAITSPLALFTNAFATFSLPQDMQKATVLVPALQSNWLIMHVSVMILSYAALLSGSLLAVAFLIIKFVDDNKRSVNIPFFSNSILGIRKSQSPTPFCLLFPPYPRRCSESFGRLAVPKALLKKNDVPSFALTSKICFASSAGGKEARKGKEALDTPWHNRLTPLEVCVMRRLNKSHFYGYSSSSAKGTEATYSFINPFVLEKQKFTNIEDLLLVQSKSSISTKQVKTLSKVEKISQAPNSYASLWKAQVASSSYLLTSLIHSSRTPTLCYPKQVSPKTYTTEKADEISFLRPLPIRGLGSWQSKNGLASRRVLDSPTPFGVRRFAGFPPTEDAKQIEDLAAYIKDVNAPKEENQSPIQNLLQILDNLSYRSIGLGFAFLTIGILSGAVWANEAWGSYWNWDPKETWAFITWLIFALYLHTRLSKGWVGKESAFVATFGFVIIWFCYLGVNLFGKGLHSYGWFHTIQ